VTFRHDEALASLRRRAVAIRITIGLHIAIDLLLIAILGLLLTQLDDPDVKTLGFAVGLVGLLSLAMMVSIVPLTIALMLWLHRARANLADFGLTDLTYSPGWTVGSFFVPVANLAVPFRSMRELYNRSHGEDVYQSLATVPDVSSWWTSFVTGATIQLALLLMSLVGILTNAYFTTPPLANAAMNMLGIFLLGLSAFFLFRIVGAVTRAQHSSTAISETFA
jgi:hypothetical protein